MVIVASEPVSEPRLTQLAISYYQKEQSNRMFIRTIRDEWSDWRELSSTDQLCNPNLLDNWYFPNPVNQRGQTEYIPAWDGYSIDRWSVESDSEVVITLVSGGIRVKNTASSLKQFKQILPIELNLVGKMVTISLLAGDVIGTVNYVLTQVNNPYQNSATCSVSTNGLFSASGTVLTGQQKIVCNLGPGAEITLLAAKLELGVQQTLAHKENGVWVLNEIPDYGEQLARCQRYYIRFGNNADYYILGTGTARSSTICGIVVPIPVKMRVRPSAVLGGRIVLRNKESAQILCSSASVDADGIGASYLACAASGLTEGAPYDAYLEPASSLYLAADL